ncbi:GNAT family N-acetyltransferase [Actinokineospora sp. HUAS TT18]|uniref:GNAT family N-acetyltransferase n=1 Tax=Actinokineospora sp. HUAS TT18 TaxID=3447451 RepID=UPI003F51EE83
MTVEVLDPRFDPEPAYWKDLRQRAGLRADWAWDVLVTQAWCARTPQPIAVFHEDGPVGVVAAAWVGPSTRRHRFVGDGKVRVGMLDVRGPGSSGVPGWWFADGSGADRIVGDYARAMRRHLGPGLRGMLVRQVAEEERGAVAGRLRLLRKTEDIGMLDLTGCATTADWTRRLAKKRGQDQRRLAARFAEDPSIEERTVPGSELDPVEVATLLRRNYDKHRDVPILPLPAFISYLTALLAQPDVVMTGYLDQPSNRLVGMSILLDHPRWPILKAWAALPPGEGGKSNLYFHNFTQVVAWATGAGKTGVILGKKNSAVKQTLGATALPQYALATPL